MFKLDRYVWRKKCVLKIVLFQLIEQERMEQLAKERQKAIEVVTKAQSESEQFSQKTKEKLRRSMEARRENRETQIRALQERLREHVGRFPWYLMYSCVFSLSHTFKSNLF